jgi:hypothetical protein
MPGVGRDVAKPALSAVAEKGDVDMAMDSRRGGRFAGGLGIGGVLVIVGVLIAIFWSLVLGIIIALVGLIAFGGFVSGRWY